MYLKLIPYNINCIVVIKSIKVDYNNSYNVCKYINNSVAIYLMCNVKARLGGLLVVCGECSFGKLIGLLLFCPPSYLFSI